MLLKFLSRFFWVLGTFDENSAMALVAKRFPNSLYKLWKHLWLLNVSLCMTTQRASSVAVEGKCQLAVSLWHGQDTHIGGKEVCIHLKYPK